MLGPQPAHELTQDDAQVAGHKHRVGRNGHGQTIQANWTVCL
jgi:hypothetical protein